ncbi:MAG: AAA family ATPase [Alphaproteobacteria bacterium]|nr:AAA family ATPase [Alphaproteobacteria bacterium]
MDGRDLGNNVLFAGVDATFRFHQPSLCLYRLHQSGERLEELGTRALEVLNVLIEQQPEAVSKCALIERVWKNGTLGNVDVQIKNLRRVLEKGAPQPGCIIQNVPRRGYRFAGKLISPSVAGPPRPLSATALEVRHGEAERRQLTVMFCDLAGSTALAARLDPEDYREVIAVYYRCVIDAVRGFDGFVAKYMGDGVLIYFGYPRAHEDDAERSIRAGLAVIDAVGRLDIGSVKLRARVGIAIGLVVVGDLFGEGSAQEQLVVGETPNLAARLQALAEPDAVVIAASTRGLVGDLFEYRDLSVVELKGIAAPVTAWQVLRPSTVESRFEALRGAVLSPLIGRDEEIELLLRRWARAKTGDGQIVLVAGEPGIGKSRLAAALSERLGAEPYLRLRYFCSPYHRDSALYPFIDQLGRAAGFALDDAPLTKINKLEALLACAAPPEGDVALLADLLSLPLSERHPLPNLSPQRKKERTIEALIHQLEGLARHQPMLLVFEDAQWIDPTSHEVLDLAIERIRSLPVLLIVTFRPEFQPPWTGEPQVTMLALNRLDRRDRTTLIGRIADGKALPDQILAQIAERTDGVPLFVEELTKNVLESGLLCEERDRYVLDGALPPLAIPTTLRDSLMARLDRSASVRHVAQIGAVIGREFSYALLRIVSRLPEDELDAALARLAASELVFQRGTPPEAAYFFKHALVQDTAYGSLLRGPRRQLHARIAKALETHSPELAESQPERLAQHYAEAGLAEKSVPYWRRAGLRSCARFVWAEALAQFQNGLDQLALLPDNPERQRQELELWNGLAGSYWVDKGVFAPETAEAIAHAEELWERLGSPAESLYIVFWQSFFHSNRAEFNLALHLDEDLLCLSRQYNDSVGLVLGHLSAGRNLMFAGKFASSQSHLKNLLALYDPISHGSIVHQTHFHPDVNALALLGIDLFCLGFPDQGLAHSKAAVAGARKLAHTHSVLSTLRWGAPLIALTGKEAALDEWIGAFAAVANEIGYPVYTAQGAFYRRWVVESTGERWFEAELNRRKGQLLLGQRQTEAAKALYCKALTIAREQQAKLWELRAAVSLARLWGEQGRRAEAYDLLAPVYGWFTEGFDTPDLKQAKVLLDAVST